MDVFALRDKVIREDYGRFARSFIRIHDDRIHNLVEDALDEGRLWPEPLVQLNPAFEPGGTVDELGLHPACREIFCRRQPDGSPGEPFRLYRHQVESIEAYQAGENYVLTTGTGSGKSLAYIVPIVDHVLREGSGKGIRAIIVYPMNALANSQLGELEKFLGKPGEDGPPPPVTFRRYTGQESQEERQEILAHPPDILLTNYVMLELILTRVFERKLVEAAAPLRFLVLDELHTYRGRQGADVAMLVRRVREATGARDVIHVGTSATLADLDSWAEQQREVARLAGLVFGVPFRPERVIGETLRRRTRFPWTFEDQEARAALRQRVEADDLPETAEAFLDDPLAAWIETTFGLRESPEGNRLVRSKPLPIGGPDGAARRLSSLLDGKVDEERCFRRVRQMLLHGHRLCDGEGRPIFAFRLHQFVSRGDAVYASLEPENRRHVTLQAQRYVPDSDRRKLLFPLAFCRECGQEFYTVRREEEEGSGGVAFVPRELSDRVREEGSTPGFLYVSSDAPWPDDPAEIAARVPDDWVDPQTGRVAKHRQKYLPKRVRVDATGRKAADGLVAWWLPAPFVLCPRCGVAYTPQQKSDFGKLGTLGSEGRSSATTVMGLSVVRELKRDEKLEPRARKLLSFTDNRQDASLQAGHFNDFVDVVLLRSALWRALDRAGDEGLRHDRLAGAVFEALALPREQYAQNPEEQFLAREETDRALREALGYRLYRDLERGWRITSPNLEQCGLLRIDYLSLPELCHDIGTWDGLHPALASASAETRERVCRVLLDYMRRELAIQVDYLDPQKQEELLSRSSQHLVEPWALTEGEKLASHRWIIPRGRDKGDKASKRQVVYLSSRGRFGRYLRRSTVFPDYGERLSVEDSERILLDLLAALALAGIVRKVDGVLGDTAGYQVRAAAMAWRRGEGLEGAHDPIRVPQKPDKGLHVNEFFRELYRSDSRDLRGLEAREHTAQVPNEVREAREEAFRKGKLPILFCSPTMELGVDIAELNVVNLRNVPPTPANYAQRSGRAGRSGQPAFVYTYCTAGSPHDQYYFRRQERMVAGAVATPRVELANEDLLRAHLRAIWLQHAGLDLGRKMDDRLVDLDQWEQDSPQLQAEVRERLADRDLRRRAADEAETVLGEALSRLLGDPGSVRKWIDGVLADMEKDLVRACERWWGLYRTARRQSDYHQQRITDPATSPADRKRSKRLRGEAETQLALLLPEKGAEFTDFYVYRYLASEGFLPGYNFPRLPLSAFIPGRKAGDDQEFLNRPRFLAVSEFGPRSLIYHEGSRYEVTRVMMQPVGEGGPEILLGMGARCESCGYMHEAPEGVAPDKCEACGASLSYPWRNLFRMQNVVTRRRDRINSDEEERFRLGYEIRTALRFSPAPGARLEAEIRGSDGSNRGRLVYGHAATLWRINLGWRRSVKPGREGFWLDLADGRWVGEPDDDEPPTGDSEVKRVIPYVVDTRNCLIVEPEGSPGLDEMATLEAALKVGIQSVFQLEDRELATEPLPGPDDRRRILLYEAAEGGAGVLRRLVEEPEAFREVLERALEIAHFAKQPDGTWKDLEKAPGAREKCEAGCYDCLLSYFNQRDHGRIDRKLLPDLLAPWLEPGVGPVIAGDASPEEHLERLRAYCDSSLEREWLEEVARRGLHLPDQAQLIVEECGVKPDFVYTKGKRVAVFIDGPVHDQPGQRERDRQQRDCLEDAGWTVIAFGPDKETWGQVFGANAWVFGSPREE